MKRNYKLYLSLIILILWIVFIFNNSLQVASISSDQSSFVKEVINLILSYLPFMDGFELSSFIIRKLAHMFEFFILALLSFNVIIQTRYYKKTYDYEIVLIQLLFCLLIAGVDETIQVFVPGRAGMFSDVLIDLSGSLIMVMLIKISYLIRGYKA